MSSIKERLASAKLPERSVQVCLRGDLAAELDDLETQIKNARATEGGARRMNVKSEAVALAERAAEVRDQMADEMLTLRLRALPNAEWRALVRSHPPKKGHDGDQAMGVNLEGLMGEAIPRCVVDPELDADDWEQLNNVLSAGDYDTLLNAVWSLNRGGVDVPKLSRLASLLIQESDAGSKPPPASE